MPTLHLRLVGDRNDADALISTLHGIDGIERVEEVDDLMPAMRDDSSSSGLVDDNEGSVYYLEVEVPGELQADAVRVIAEIEAERRGIAVEFVDEF